MMQVEVKSRQVQGPARLPTIQFLSGHKILQVLVVCPDLKLVARAFKEMPPFLKGTNDCKHFLVVDLVVVLNRVQAFGEE